MLQTPEIFVDTTLVLLIKYLNRQDSSFIPKKRTLHIKNDPVLNVAIYPT